MQAGRGNMRGLSTIEISSLRSEFRWQSTDEKVWYTFHGSQRYLLAI